MTENSASKDHASMKRKIKPIALLTYSLLIVSAILLYWYVMADRYTPYTDLARVKEIFIPVTPRVSGYLDKIHVQLHSKVEEGQIIFELDSRPYEIALMQSEANLDNTIQKSLDKLGLKSLNQGSSMGSNFFGNGEIIESYSPVNGKLIGTVTATTKEDYELIIDTAQKAFKSWRLIPAPQRGEIVRQFGDKLRDLKQPLGELVSYEMGKSLQEGLGEVQEMIDICDFAVGLSRQLHGFTMHSERAGHRMYEQYHPLGIVGIISAFNFPVAVWAWNTALAWICGDVCVWKASEKTPLCSIACQHIIAGVLNENNLPEGISCIINGNYRVGEYLTKDKRIPLISATGSTRMGKIVGRIVGERLGKSLLELGGNNAIIVTPEADLKMTIIGSVFGAVGTAGQRCTSTRRLIIHDSMYQKVKDALLDAYGQIRIGNPLDENNHMGPLIDSDAVLMYQDALSKAEVQGAKILLPGGVLKGAGYESGCYVKPVIIEANNELEIVQCETFAPILYLLQYSGGIENALKLQNGVDQGLSSAIMTNNLREAERFLSVEGSDCGIANVNIGTSGAEIGGAFGGEKDTGGGRESGSDAWKVYMRRQTNTINYTTNLPLAQGIKFDL
jgi:aldehyde dehydrogenase (NAD+)